MAIDFPSTNGQATDGSFTHAHNGLTWVWNGTSWSKQGSYLASQNLTSFSVVKPNPTASGSGDFTYDNTTGEFTYTPPVIPAAQVQSDWNASGTLGEILNKPTVPVNINDLNNVNTSPIEGDILKWDHTNSEWISGSESGGGSGSTLTVKYLQETGPANNNYISYFTGVLGGYANYQYDTNYPTGFQSQSWNNWGGWINPWNAGGQQGDGLLFFTLSDNSETNWELKLHSTSPNTSLTSGNQCRCWTSTDGENWVYQGTNNTISTTTSITITSAYIVVTDLGMGGGSEVYLEVGSSSVGGVNYVSLSQSRQGIGVSNAATSSLTGGLTYDSATGQFEYTPVDLTTSEKNNWNTAHGWGNHASAGYLTSAPGEANVQVDWNVTNTSHDAYIKNKPTTFSNGNTGFVPAPLANGNNSAQFLRGDGTWATPIDTDTNTTYGVVNTVNNGLCPFLPAGPNNKFLRSDGTWEVPPDTDTNTTYTLGATDGSGSKIIRLLTGAGASAGDVILTEGTGMTISRSGNNITLESTATGGSTSSIPSGTAMMFVQGSAPTGWTKSGSHNNKALRVVSGSGGGSGGSVGFTSAFTTHSTSGTVSFTVDESTDNETASGTVGSRTSTGSVDSGGGSTTGNDGSGTYSFSDTTDNKFIAINDVTGNHTLTTSQMPIHSHDFDRTRYATLSGGGGTPGAEFGTLASGAWSETDVQSAGSGSSHYHSINVSNTHNHDFSGSISIGNHNHSTPNHSHGLSMNSHNHSFSGDAHNHDISFTASGTSSMNSINLSVQYVDVIICTKD